MKKYSIVSNGKKEKQKHFAFMTGILVVSLLSMAFLCSLNVEADGWLGKYIGGNGIYLKDMHNANPISNSLANELANDLKARGVGDVQVRTEDPNGNSAHERTPQWIFRT